MFDVNIHGAHPLEAVPRTAPLFVIHEGAGPVKPVV
jgi:hypothetical protein